jgi:glucokinase
MGHHKFVAAIDLGGTWVRVALSDKNGNFHAKTQEATDAASAESISNQLVRLVRFVCNNSGVDISQLVGVGIASAGPLDMKKGVLIQPTNIPLDVVPLTGPVSDALGVPAYLVNDGTAGVLGERRFGAGQRVDNLVYVAIGTGIGGGAIVDGHVLLGKDGNAVEIGHFVIDYEGRLTCGCGKKGHWEAYCCGRNIPNFVRMRLTEVDSEVVSESLLCKDLDDGFANLSAQALFASAKRGVKLALQLVEEIGVLNAIGFANLVNAYDPSLITVGGAVVLQNTQLVVPPIRKHVEAYALNRVPKIMATPLGDEAGLYGAGAAVAAFSSYA